MNDFGQHLFNFIVPKQNRQALVKRKLKAVAHDLNESFEAVAGTDQLEVSIDDHSSAGEYREAKSVVTQLMNSLKVQSKKATTHSDQAQILTLKLASWTIKQTTQFFQCSQYAVQQTNFLKKEYGVLAPP